MNRNKLNSHILAVDIASRYGTDAAITSQFQRSDGEPLEAAARHSQWRASRAEQMRSTAAAAVVVPDVSAEISHAAGK